MRILFTAIAAAVLAACSGGDHETEAVTAAVQEVAEDTRIAAVLIHADWCSSCKIIEPKLAAVKERGAIDGLQHAAINYTDRDKEAFYANAEKLGLADPIRTHLDGDVKTGIILLIDTDTKEIVADLRKELTEEELRVKMIEAAAV